MRIPGWVILIGVVFLGALVLAPVIAYLGIKALPGDITLVFQGRQIFLPLTQGLIASVALGLLFLWARK